MGRCRCSQGGLVWGLASPGPTVALLPPSCTHGGDSWASPPAGFGCSPPGEALPPPCQNFHLRVTPRAGQLPPELLFSTGGGSGTRGGKVCSGSHKKEPPARREHNLRFLPPWRKEGASTVTREHHFLSGNPSARGGVGRRAFFPPCVLPVAETAG